MRNEIKCLGVVLKPPSQAIKLIASGIINKGKCILKGYSICANGAAGTVDIYDGTNNRGEFKFRITIADGYTESIDFSDGVTMEKGIYVVINATTTHTTIWFRTVDQRIDI